MLMFLDYQRIEATVKTLTKKEKLKSANASPYIGGRRFSVDYRTPREHFIGVHTVSMREFCKQDCASGAHIKEAGCLDNHVCCIDNHLPR